MEKTFNLVSDKALKGDQGKALDQLIKNNKKFNQHCLLGATGTGKTFTIANFINKLKNKSTLVLVHNKTLANQLFVEFKELFPDNRVEYFISSFDYYRPEAYLPTKDLYIEKTSQSNEEIERLRLSSMNSLMSGEPTIVIATVASIYGLQHPDIYVDNIYEFRLNESIIRKSLIFRLVEMGYKRSLALDNPGTFRVNGDLVEIIPSYSNKYIIKVDLFDDKINDIYCYDKVTNTLRTKYDSYTLFPSGENFLKSSLAKQAIPLIKQELEERLKYFKKNDMLLEYQRLEQRVNLDLEQLKEFGMTSGIENYSFHLDSWRKKLEPPATLMDYFKDDFLMVVDESHITLSQVRAMYLADRSRKTTLVDYGFRLPSALDNRPLKFEEWEKKINKIVYVTATPADYELEKAAGAVVEQINRPTGLLDPEITIKPIENSLTDLIVEIKKRIKKDERVFVNTLTKRMSEDISQHLNEQEISTAYIHSELNTFEREVVLRNLRLGKIDVVIGINLLREGLDIPEVSLMAILDADKEGFLRNTKTLIQLIGRVARNVNGHVIMYADKMTNSMKVAIDETDRRRTIQSKFNEKYKITPKSIIKPIPSNQYFQDIELIQAKQLSKKQLNKKLEEFRKIMDDAADNRDFETAIKYRDLILELDK